jgi:hypothetical protein
VTIPTPVSAASANVTTEAVANYTVQGSGNLPNSPVCADGFKNNLLIPGSPWTSGPHYRDNSVFDTDFLDYNTFASGQDDSYFDSPGRAISFFAGHGICSGGSTVACSSTTQCNSPNAANYEKLPGTCRNSPRGSNCAYLTDRALYTSSTLDNSSHRAVYSRVWSPLQRQVAWGESANSGAWSGANTNGGTNLAVLSISCGVLSPYWAQQLLPMFAGLQYIATVMPVDGDTNDSPNRGGAFSNRWRNNAAEPMANAWTYTLNDTPLTDGNQCAGTNYNLGGGHGINGCGCNFIMSSDNQPRAYQKMKTGNWNTLRDDANDALSSNSYYWFAVCNYDTATYPWEKP